jgi:FMN phosphatase YigB (HAD superfamily)
LAGAEKSRLEDVDLELHEEAVAGLLTELEQAGRDFNLPELPAYKDVLNDLLIRVRLIIISNST